MTPTQTRIYKLIKKGKIMNVSEMARELGVSRPTFYDNVDKMKEKGLIIERTRFIAVE
jgi:Mn-dependent DtxR family transcriptional regulator